MLLNLTYRTVAEFEEDKPRHAIGAPAGPAVTANEADDLDCTIAYEILVALGPHGEAHETAKRVIRKHLGMDGES